MLMSYAQGMQAAFWLWVPLLLAAARPQREGFRRRVAILAGAELLTLTSNVTSEYCRGFSNEAWWSVKHRV